MSRIAIQKACLLKTSCHGMGDHHKVPRISAFWTMTVNSKSSNSKRGELSIEPRKLSVSPLEVTTPANLQFDRLQPSDEELIQEKGIEFGWFMAREAVIDEEYWTAAWLRAESHWESSAHTRYADNSKRKFAEQEFNALKRRCRGKFGHKHTCIVAGCFVLHRIGWEDP